MKAYFWYLPRKDAKLMTGVKDIINNTSVAQHCNVEMAFRWNCFMSVRCTHCTVHFIDDINKYALVEQMFINYDAHCGYHVLFVAIRVHLHILNFIPKNFIWIMWHVQCSCSIEHMTKISLNLHMRNESIDHGIPDIPFKLEHNV